MEKPLLTASAVAFSLLRNLMTTAIVFADKPLLHFAGKYKLLDSLRALLINCVLFFLRLIHHQNREEDHKFKPAKQDIGTFVDSGIGRALSQLLSIMSDIPVSSRKYELVRLQAEKLIDENRRENSAALLDLNRTSLSTAFSGAVRRLEAAVWRNPGEKGEPVRYWLNSTMKAAVKSVGDRVWGQVRWIGEETEDRCVATEKVAEELVWLAEKMVDCGFGEDAVERWASASKLAWLAISAEPRIHSPLVRLSALLFKLAKEHIRPDESKKDQRRQTRKKMLLSWLPFLCRASNGTDAPILTTNEKFQFQKTLEGIIESLDIDEQEQVLSLWLHHFAHCSSSDWPNLHSSYARWCTSSRKLML